jgi:hypothetical protein
MPTFPCGGFDTVSNNRTVLSLTEGSLPVDIDLHPTQAAVQILLGLGSKVGTSYNITLEHTFSVTGAGEFCLPNIPLDPATLGTSLTDGMNASLQVVTNGDTGGGFYSVCTLLSLVFWFALPSQSATDGTS